MNDEISWSVARGIFIFVICWKTLTYLKNFIATVYYKTLKGNRS